MATSEPNLNPPEHRQDGVPCAQCHEPIPDDLDLEVDMPRSFRGGPVYVCSRECAHGYWADYGEWQYENLKENYL